MVIYLMEKFMSIMDKLKKNSKIKTTEVLQESKFFTEKDMVATDVPMVNVALSGSIDGGVGIDRPSRARLSILKLPLHY